ncbi:MAG TPA: 6-bladed beta-propeller [Solirubrobacterales bacterium]|nr:6-bladed beta-propeller [Solirubrobacterales bacterium]
MEMHSGIDRPGLAGCPIVHEQPSHLFKSLGLNWITLGFGTLVLMFAVFVTGISPSIAKAEVDSRFSFSFGSYGEGNGQFKTPQDIALDSSGNVWIADTSNNRIQKFNSKGEYLSQFGTKGTGNGQFKEPYGIAIDASNNIWIADTFNNRIQKFNSKGEYLSQFGTASLPYHLVIDSSGKLWITVQSGLFGVLIYNSGGILTNALKSGHQSGIAMDSNGDIWVVDQSENRVQEFNANYEILSEFGTEGEEAGQFLLPRNIAIDSGDNMWIGDFGNARVQRFDPEGEYLSQFLGEKEEPSQEPTGIAIDSSDNVWVVEEGARVEKWIPNRPTTTTEAASEVISKAATMHGTVNPNGLATAYRFEVGTTTSYGFSVPVTDKGIGSGKSGVEVSEELAGLKSKTTYHFRVVATNAEGTSYGKDETFTTK